MATIKTPMARKEARNYCRRCLAVMLCCVLVFSLTVRTAPRAKAVVAEAAIAGVMDGAAMGGGLAGGPVGAVLGMLVASAAGLVYRNSGVSTSGITGMASPQIVYGSRGYDYGQALATYLKGLGGTIAAWWDSLVARFTAQGGVKEGDTFEIPAEAVNAARSWAQSNFDFSKGAQLIGDAGILTADGDAMVLTQFPADAEYGKFYDLTALGTLYPISTVLGDVLEFNFVGADGTSYRHVFTGMGSDNAFKKPKFSYDYFVNGVREGGSESLIGGSDSSMFVTYAWLPGSSGDLDRGTYYLAWKLIPISYVLPINLQYLSGTWDNDIFLCSNNVVAASEINLDTTLEGSEYLDDTQEGALSVVVPPAAGSVEVDGSAVPVYDVLTPGAVAPGLAGTEDPAIPSTAPGITAGELQGAVSGAIADTLPGVLADSLPVTGAVAGDAVVGEALADPDSLGAVFTSKFPFSIPWDVVKAISLLAAPPVTPRWEVDFMSPIAYRVGGFEGGTTVVLDFSEYEIIGQVTRWVSMVLFVYALAAGTKRLIWTA